MNMRNGLLAVIRECAATLCIAMLVSGSAARAADPAPQATPPAADQTVKLPPDQPDPLVAPIALYPDQMLGNVLMASTYLLEIIQLQQWLAQNKNLKDKAENIKWTTDLGNAFLAQQDDVMASIAFATDTEDSCTNTFTPSNRDILGRNKK